MPIGAGVMQGLDPVAWTVFIENSRLLSPAIWVLHFFSFFLFIGLAALLNLRLLGLAFPKQSLSQLGQALRFPLWSGFVLAVFTGLILFLPDAKDFLRLIWFWIKLAATLASAIVTIVIQFRMKEWDQQAEVPVSGRALAMISLLLWLGVIFSASAGINYSY